MTRDNFSIEGISGLSGIPRGSKIHVIGVCGVAMAQLAIELARQGYEVSGSDKEFYEPMGGLLARSRIRILRGYRPENISPDVSLVVIGNAVMRDHPEVLKTAELNLPYSIFPALLHELVIAGTKSISVAGTHGKSTATALTAFGMERLGLRPGYFIGAVAKDLPDSLSRGAGSFSAVEGDEYDSCFFAKVPKFRFYHPDVAIITSVEFDHADIYRDLEHVAEQFDWLASSIPAGGRLVCCLDDATVRSRCSAWQSACKGEVVTYGRASGAQWRLISAKPRGGIQEVRAAVPVLGEIRYELSLFGAYNALNSVAVLAASAGLGLDPLRFCSSFSSFHGVKRRQEIRLEHPLVLIEDFAHHPTAVRETLSGIRESFPEKRLWAVFEPRSNTSRRRVFESGYLEAFAPADHVILCDVETRSVDQGQELLDVAALSRRIASKGKDCLSLPSPDAIFEYVSKRAGPSDLVLVMSNGSFGGLAQRLEDYFGGKM